MDAHMLGDTAQIQVQRHDEMRIAWVRATTLLDTFPQQLAVWARSVAYPNNRAERIENGRFTVHQLSL
ncbi:hypothetical protein [Pseudomonas piscis]